MKTKISQISHIPLYFIPYTLYLLFTFTCRAQDAHFSQFYNSPLTLNPSLAGTFDGKIRVIANYRNQWQSVATPFKTFAFSSDMSFFRKRESGGFLGAGLSFISDKAGDSELGLNQVNLSIAYHAKISGHSILSAGIQGGFAQRSINFSALMWDNQYDGNSFNQALSPNEPDITNNHSYPDFGAGMQWAYSKGEMFATANNQFFANVGISVFHINSPNVSFYSTAKDNLPLKITGHGALQMGINNSKYSLEPSFEYVQQSSLKDIVAGLLMRIKLQDESKYTGFVKGAALSLGSYYRIGDAVIPAIQLEIAEYALGVSYDINTSALKAVSQGRGGFEISIRYNNPNPFTGKPTTKTPRFFN